MIKIWFKTFYNICLKEIFVYKTTVGSKLIDLLIMMSTNVIVFNYLMPYFGVKANYGFFIILGLIPALNFFDIVPKSINLIVDITSYKKISYILTLPLPSFLSIAAIPLSWAIQGCLYTILILPIAKIIFWNKFSFENFSFFKFIIAFILYNSMFGFFALYLASMIKSMKYVSWIWARIVNPLFMLGGYFYSWKAVFSISHIAGYINLINPVMFATEAIRSSVLKSDEFIPYWLSILVMLIFTLIFAFLGIRKLKKRLDCV
jgi:ABC-type polysaccharide/polyol phosphate export permease